MERGETSTIRNNNIAMINKTTFVELSRALDRPIILFGSGNIAGKTLRKLTNGEVAFIVDNSTNLQGTTYEGFDIKKPSEITRDYFVLICSTAIAEIGAQLEGLGLKPNIDFTISPILNDLLAIKELEDLSSSFYFTSGTVASDEPEQGGGLYQCQVNGAEVVLKKLYAGPCYGAIRKEDEIIFVDTDKGLMSYHQEKGVTLLGALPTGSRAHGISYNQKKGHFFVTCSYLDAVLEVDEHVSVIRQFSLSNKLKNEGEPMHHCNDNCTAGNSLFVSMFSSSGNWKRDSFDGCIAEFDLESGERLGDVTNGLYMPHNVLMIDGSLHVLDSLPGHLRFNNFSIQGTFPAFTRGLTFANGLYYVGQSKNRNYSKVLGLSNNISIDCGVIVFNPELKVSRFLQFPYAIGEIHAIVI
jgi:hypothetical protein